MTGWVVPVLSKDKIFNWSKLKAFADENLNIAKMMPYHLR